MNQLLACLISYLDPFFFSWGEISFFSFSPFKDGVRSFVFMEAKEPAI
jgi:hypothetical protein